MPNAEQLNALAQFLTPALTTVNTIAIALFGWLLSRNQKRLEAALTKV